jgi:hypothetical protein
MFLLFFNNISAQNIEFNKIEFRGLKFLSSKNEIIKKIGNPLKIYEPNYDCGGLSSEWQGVDFFTLDYGNIKFTGNDNDGYLIEEINFVNDKSFALIYDNYTLNSETKLINLIEVFGKQILLQIKENQPIQVIIINSSEIDDGIKLVLKDGKLIKFLYWSPC